MTISFTKYVRYMTVCLTGDETEWMHANFQIYR